MATRNAALHRFLTLYNVLFICLQTKLPGGLKGQTDRVNESKAFITFCSLHLLASRNCKTAASDLNVRRSVHNVILHYEIYSGSSPLPQPSNVYSL